MTKKAHHAPNALTVVTVKFHNPTDGWYRPDYGSFVVKGVPTLSDLDGWMFNGYNCFYDKDLECYRGCDSGFYIGEQMDKKRDDLEGWYADDPDELEDELHRYHCELMENEKNSVSVYVEVYKRAKDGDYTLEEIIFDDDVDSIEDDLDKETHPRYRQARYEYISGEQLEDMMTEAASKKAA